MENNKVGGLILLDFTIYFKVTVNQNNVVLAQRQTYIDHWDKSENSEVNPFIYDQLIFDKGAKTIQWRNKVFSTNGMVKIECPYEKEKKKRPLLRTSYNIHKI